MGPPSSWLPTGSNALSITTPRAPSHVNGWLMHCRRRPSICYGSHISVRPEEKSRRLEVQVRNGRNLCQATFPLVYCDVVVCKRFSCHPAPGMCFVHPILDMLDLGIHLWAYRPFSVNKFVRLHTYMRRWVSAVLFVVIFIGMVWHDTNKWWRLRRSKAKRTGEYSPYRLTLSVAVLSSYMNT